MLQHHSGETGLSVCEGFEEEEEAEALAAEERQGRKEGGFKDAVCDTLVELNGDQDAETGFVCLLSPITAKLKFAAQV